MSLDRGLQLARFDAAAFEIDSSKYQTDSSPCLSAMSDKVIDTIAHDQAGGTYLAFSLDGS